MITEVSPSQVMVGDRVIGCLIIFPAPRDWVNWKNNVAYGFLVIEGDQRFITIPYDGTGVSREQTVGIEYLKRNYSDVEFKFRVSRKDSSDDIYYRFVRGRGWVLE